MNCAFEFRTARRYEKEKEIQLILFFSKINHTEPVAYAWLWICLLDIFLGKKRLLWKQGFNDKLTLFPKMILEINFWIVLLSTTYPEIKNKSLAEGKHLSYWIHVLPVYFALIFNSTYPLDCISHVEDENSTVFLIGINLNTGFPCCLKVEHSSETFCKPKWLKAKKQSP